MSTYQDLLQKDASETELRRFFAEGNQTSITLRIPDTLHNAAKEEANLRGMSFAAFVRTCLIEELTRKGA